MEGYVFLGFMGLTVFCILFPLEKQYYNHINLLRGIAAFMVCVFHFGQLDTLHGHLFDPGSTIRKITDIGYLGVCIFFVLSGFVIPVSLQNSEFKFNRFHRFLLRRFIRIEIPYFVSILLIILVGIIFSKVNQVDFQFDTERLISHLFYLVSFTGHKWYNDIYWTLAIEIQFYILMAFIFFILNRYKYGSFILLLTLISISCVYPDPRFIIHFIPCFVAGISCWQLKQKKIEIWMFVILMIASCCVAGYLFRYHETIVIFLTALFILLAPDMKSQKFTIGKISYSLYLTHGVIGGNIIYFLVNKTHSFAGNVLIFMIALLASLVFAYVFYILIEKPSINISKKIRN